MFPSFDFSAGDPMRGWPCVLTDVCVAGGRADVGGLDDAGAHVKQGEGGNWHGKEESQRNKQCDEEGFDEEPQADEQGKQVQPGSKGGADGTDPAGVCGLDGVAADGATAGYAAHS